MCGIEPRARSRGTPEIRQWSDHPEISPLSLAVRLRTGAPELDTVFAGMAEQVSVQDIQDRYLYANKAVLESFDARLGDVVGRTWQELGAGGEIAAALRTQREEARSSGEQKRGTLTFRTDAGEGTVTYSVSPVEGPGGRVEGTTTVSSVTSGPPDALANEDAAPRYRAVFEHSTEGAMLIDGAITSMNPAAESILGLSIEDLKTYAFDDPHWVVVRDDGTTFPPGAHPMSVARDTGEPVIDVLMGFRNPLTGVNHWLTVSVIPVVSGEGSGRENMTLVMFNDVTAQRRATEEDRELRLRIEKEALDHSSALYDIKGKLAAELRHHEAADNQARQSLAGTLQALARISEMRDMYTAGHQERVAGLCVAIATELGWSEDQRRFVKLAASLHDIGKMAVPAEILSKPSSLTYAEFELVKSHAEASVAILEHITFPWPIAEVVGQHHERLDGSGYPLGLTGDLIMPEAKVIAVADVVEAIASHRPYRPALGVDRALEEIRRGRGSLYDAEAVDACIAVFERGDFSFSEPTNPKVDVSSTSRRRQ